MKKTLMMKLLTAGPADKKQSYLAIVAGAALAVFLLLLPQFASLGTISLFGRIFILSVFGMSYDILRGYTGVINLGHALFFGSGTYLVGIVLTRLGPTPLALLIAVLATIVYCALAAFIMGKIAFRRGGVIACAMITLALGEMVRHLAEALRYLTRGADGLTFPIPALFANRVHFYYIALFFLVAMTLVLRSFIFSPTGRVLLAIRENEQRATFLGYNTTAYKMISLQVAGIAAGLSGAMFALLTRFANTDLLTVQQTLNALLVTIVGGTGTLYGAIVGTALVQLVQNYLLTLRGVHPIFTRWLLFFGSFYILVILFMPTGIIGAYSKISARMKLTRAKLSQPARHAEQKSDEGG